MKRILSIACHRNAGCVGDGRANIGLGSSGRLGAVPNLRRRQTIPARRLPATARRRRRIVGLGTRPMREIIPRAFPSGTKIDATLATSLDAKRSKPGDEVEARAEEDVKQDGKVVLKKGTRLVGHVTQAQAASQRADAIPARHHVRSCRAEERPGSAL